VTIQKILLFVVLLVFFPGRGGALEEDLIKASRSGNVTLLKSLLDKGTPINGTDQFNRTALIHAASTEHIGIIELLLDRGALIDKTDKYGRTALMYAVRSGKYEAIKLLLKRGAQIGLKDQYGETALIMAAKRENVNIVKILVENGAQVNFKDPGGDSPLMWASLVGNPHIVKILLESGADVTLRGKEDGLTAMMIAENKGHKEVVLLLKRAEANASKVENMNLVMDEFYFLEKFTEALKINDQVKMTELIRRAEPIIFNAVIILVDEGRMSILEDRKEPRYFDLAKLIAEIYAKEFNKKCLLQLVERYRLYNRISWETLMEGYASIDRGNSFLQVGKYENALKIWTEALKIFNELADVRGKAKVLTNIGTLNHRLGRVSKALESYQEALEINRQIGNFASEATNLMNIGLFYFSLGQLNESSEYQTKALEMCRKIKDKSLEGKILTNIGAIYLVLGRFEDALKYSKDALKIKREISLKGGKVTDEATTLGNIGLIYEFLGQLNESLSYYKQAIEIDKETGNIGGEATALGNIGHLYMKLGQYEKAIQELRKSIEISKQIGEIETAWKSHRSLGIALWKYNKPMEAIIQYGKAIELIEDLYRHTQVLKEEERSSMIGGKSFVYQEFIELLLELHRKSPNKGYDREAFLISERSKSRTFREMMAKAGARTVFSGDETFKKMVEREQQLIGEVINLQGLLTKELSKPEEKKKNELVESLKGQLSKAGKSLSDIEKEIESKYPRYADLKRPKPLTLEELQDILKPDETLISYAVGKDKTAAFVIGKKSFKLMEVNINREGLAKLVKNFRKGVEEVGELKDLEEFDPKIAYELYQKVFQSLSSELKGVVKLYISADDILYTLPFEALVDKEIDLQSFRQARSKSRSGEGAYLGEYGTLHYLLDTYTITYLPSASVLGSLRKYEKPGYGRWTRPLIAFADPIFNEEEAEGEKKMKGKGISKETQLTAQILTRSTGIGKLERLTESAQEAEAVAKVVNGIREDVYLREKATEEKVYQTKLKEARYILFSTHGLLGGDFSGVAEPSLVLTLIGNTSGKDGFLTMSEVLGLDLNAEMVILSACNTSGRGEKADNGEGFAGLTRSFMYAGSKSLLVTHWSVESEAARDLMVETFKNMQKGGRPEALREAKLNMKKFIRQMGKEKVSLSHPFFWAPFVLVGESK